VTFPTDSGVTGMSLPSAANVVSSCHWTKVGSTLEATVARTLVGLPRWRIVPGAGSAIARSILFDVHALGAFPKTPFSPLVQRQPS